MRKFPGARLAPLLAVASVLAGSASAATPVAAATAASLDDGAVPAAPRQASRQPGREPSLPELQARLDRSDRIAALSALQMALNWTADGSTFIWKKNNRDLKGVIKPTTAFRNAYGQVCRHVVYAISLGRYRKQIELVACREAGGRWRL